MYRLLVSDNCNIVEPVDYTENFNLETITTPVRVIELIKQLKASNYPPNEVTFLENGFSNGFDIGYDGPEDRQSRAKNLPLKVGTKEQLWNKIIKEVRLGRVAGPFNKIPFKNYIQSPIGLVPKVGGDQTC